MKARQATYLMIALSFVLLPAIGFAQSQGTSALAGTVRDSSGAVLPGVTVEAASPALIEKVRSVVTDSQGRYQVADLPPGVYSVTFTLPGFRVVRREGLALTANFAATVNAELEVGSLEETITVSGETPMVDIRNITQQRSFSREVVDTLPIGVSTQALAVLIPAASASLGDVGGVTPGVGGFNVHGGTGDTRHLVAGMSIDSPQQQGGNGAANVNKASVGEVNVEIGGMSAEAETGGVQLHLVPKDGGNTFSFYSSAAYTNGDLQSDNLSEALRARGLRAKNAMKRAYDYNAALGGPILQDKLWFFTAHRWVASEVWAPVFFNAEPNDSWSYTPDPSRQGFNRRPFQNSNFRATWQAAAKHKFTFTAEPQFSNCNCSFGLGPANRAPEASADHNYGPQYLLIGTWTYPATNRLLLEATVATFRLDQVATPIKGVTPDLIAVEDLATNFLYRARGPGLDEGISYYTKTHFNHTQRFSLSYVTGTHSFKTGILVHENTSKHTHTQNGDSTYRFRNGVPAELAMWASPWNHDEVLAPIIGIFAQDQLSMGQLTLNLGVRVDSMSGYIPEQDMPAGRWVPARRFDRVDDALAWKDINPRLGAAYDVFGDGRTAIKASLGRFVLGQGTSNFLAAINPVLTISGSATREWRDANRDFIPQEEELGRISNDKFGQVKTPDTVFADDAVRGWGNREYTWQGSVSFQRELWPGTLVDVGYFRTSYGNILAIDNRAVSAAANYDPYCITAPVDSRLPGGGGNEICGLFDITPTAFGKVDNVVTQASNFGDVSEVFNGVDLTVTSRFRGALVSGGVSTGARTTDYCDVSNATRSFARGRVVVADVPDRRFCSVSPPWSAGTQTKFAAMYPLPGEIQVSAVVQNLPGPEILANLVARNADARPSLGRNLASGRATIPLIEPGTLYEDRVTQVDFRVAKTVRVGGARVQGIIELFNALNADSILAVNNTYGPSWRNVNSILGGRLLKFGTQIEF